jgi:hypothetical protein
VPALPGVLAYGKTEAEARTRAIALALRASPAYRKRRTTGSFGRRPETSSATDRVECLNSRLRRASARHCRCDRQ